MLMVIDRWSWIVVRRFVVSLFVVLSVHSVVRFVLRSVRSMVKAVAGPGTREKHPGKTTECTEGNARNDQRTTNNDQRSTSNDHLPFNFLDGKLFSYV
jgi:hypothetical protein